MWIQLPGQMPGVIVIGRADNEGAEGLSTLSVLLGNPQGDAKSVHQIVAGGVRPSRRLIAGAVALGLTTVTAGTGFAAASEGRSDAQPPSSDRRNSESRSERRNKQIVVKSNELAFRDDRDAEALALVGDTYTNYEGGGVTTDRATLEQFLGAIGANPTFAIDEALADKDKVVVRYETNFGGVAGIGIDIYRVVDGKIVEHWDSFALPTTPPPTG